MNDTAASSEKVIEDKAGIWCISKTPIKRERKKDSGKERRIERGVSVPAKDLECKTELGIGLDQSLVVRSLPNHANENEKGVLQCGNRATPMG